MKVDKNRRATKRGKQRRGKSEAKVEARRSSMTAPEMLRRDGVEVRLHGASSYRV